MGLSRLGDGGLDSSGGMGMGRSRLGGVLGSSGGMGMGRSRLGGDVVGLDSS
jgi:hypothetical protein